MIKHLSRWIAQRVSWLRQQFSTNSRNLAKLHRATAIFVKVFPEHLENMFWDLSKLSVQETTHCSTLQVSSSIQILFANMPQV